jgi:hypothetical protein
VRTRKGITHAAAPGCIDPNVRTDSRSAGQTDRTPIPPIYVKFEMHLKIPAVTRTRDAMSGLATMRIKGWPLLLLAFCLLLTVAWIGIMAWAAFVLLR